MQSATLSAAGEPHVSVQMVPHGTDGAVGDVQLQPAPPSMPPPPLATLIDELVVQVLVEVDQRDFTADDFIHIAARLQDIVLTQHATMTPLQQKTLVLKVLNRVVENVMPRVESEVARAAIRLVLMASGTLFDVLRAAFLKQFDLNNDDQVSPEEFNAVCKTCCCVPVSK